MRHTKGLIAAPLLCVVWCVLGAGGDDRPGGAFVQTERYELREIQGWQVRVNKALLEGEHEEIGHQAIALLEMKLGDIVGTIPAAALARLREIPIWLGVADGHAPCAEYHPSRQWLIDHGYNPDKARCVEIGNAARFIEWSKTQPWMVFHELAHGYHDRVLGFDNNDLRAAHRRAKESGRYEKVARRDGRAERHYALSNPQEFFAELSESFFGVNDFYPFDREELSEFDAESEALVERLWNLAPGAGETRESDEG